MKMHFSSAALCAVLLSACSILPESRPSDTYRLPTALSVPDRAAPQRNGIGSIRVLRPTSGNQLSGRRISVVPDDLRISVYANAAWTDTVPELLRERLADALRTSARFDAVSTDQHSLRAEFEINTDLRSFQSEYRSGVPDARSNSVTSEGSVSSKMAATMSGASVVRLTIRLRYARSMPSRLATSVRLSASPDSSIANHR
jgi:cholesterol transport system auxiliary component